MQALPASKTPQLRKSRPEAGFGAHFMCRHWLAGYTFFKKNCLFTCILTNHLLRKRDCISAESELFPSAVRWYVVWGFLCCSSSLCFLPPHHLQEVDPQRLSHTPSSSTPPGCGILPSHCFLPSPSDSFGHTSPWALGRQRSDLLWAVPSAQTCSWREPSGVCSVSSAGPGLSST